MREWQEKYKDVSLKYNMFAIQSNIFLSVLGLIVQMLAFLYCLWLLWTGAITYGTMTLFLQQRTSLSNAFNNVVMIVPNFLNSSVSAHRIRELVELPRDVHIPDSSELEEYIEEGFTVRMGEVNFAYLEDNKVISDSEFIAQPGEIVALVGPSGEGIREMARVCNPENGLELVCRSDAPGLLVYTANGLAAEPGKGGRVYGRNWAVCLETERFPNAVNHPRWRGQVLLRPGEVYRSATTFTFLRHA